MGTPYLGEIRLISFNFPPRGWAFCNGQTMSIQQNQALFALLGTTYGGNGTNTFQLPNLQGRVVVGVSASYLQGQVGGQDSVALLTSQIPAHNHGVNVSMLPGNSSSPESRALAKAPLGLGNVYGASPNANLGPASVDTTGENQPHENHQPSLTLNYIIALQGIFPSRS
ncbi:MAG TPA: tail fiber protein [Fimbriimonadaceae bacterium]|nr:tail fiber protein [Fimbriimonadaceae bacterium]